jgi:hypothetical protein
LVELAPFSANDPGGAGNFGLPVGQQVFPTPGAIIGGGNAPQPVSPQVIPATQAMNTAIPVEPISTPLARPTIDPTTDSAAPVPFMIPLPIISPPAFDVSWSAHDDSGIASFTVWVRVDGGEWQTWLDDTAETQAVYNGESGHRYEFAVWARDLAGNWSLNTELTPLAQTAVQ